VLKNEQFTTFIRHWKKIAWENDEAIIFVERIVAKRKVV
jgi:hypothetical protein